MNNKILLPSGMNTDSLLIGQAPRYEAVPRVTGVKAVGSQVLIEILTVQELAGTSLAMTEKTDLKVPLQGYILGAGPGFKSADWGFGVGDRVLISGTGVMAPKYDASPRDRFFMEPSAVKSVLQEEAA